MSDTIAAIATGAQVAAIGIIRLSGERAIALARRAFSAIFRRQNERCAGQKAGIRQALHPGGGAAGPVPVHREPGPRELYRGGYR